MRLRYYRHTQFGAVVAGILLSLSAVAVGAELMTGPSALTVVGPVLMAVFLLLFGTLTVEIDETHLRFRFGIGLIRKSIPLAEIVEARPVRTTWADGWGIHYTARGWLYNVSGWEAVEITLVSGQRLRLGTDEPQHLTQALLAARVFRSPVRGTIG
ncbi:MAG: hypothetical protein P9F19_01735 [Candidatus Contendobacter sp.]|nr:hypothetical protein [Candidatus Contendobacter sp.]MDG4556110.1 hypothetical protein [Candidatus Contendobacter sp.]